MRIKSIRTIPTLMLVTMLNIIIFQPASALSGGEANPQALPASKPSGPSTPDEFEAFLDAYLSKQMEAHHIPGVVFTMVKDGEVFFTKGYGYADLEKKVPFDPKHTILTTASVSKAFVALAVLQLYDQGLIDLHEDVHPYINDFELPDRYPGGLTFANLLTHTDGFESRMIGIISLTEDNLRPLSEMLSTYTPAQICPPGELMTYGDFAANLAGHLVAEISDTTFEQYMADNVISALGMTNSTFDLRLSEEMLAGLARAYEYQNGSFEPVPFFYVAYSPMGGLRSTAEDMNRFMLALLNGGEYQGKRILSEEATQLMFTQQFTSHPKIAGISYGLFEHLENGHQLFFRDGDGVGTRSRVVFFPKKNLGFYIAYNSSENTLRLDIISAILDEYYVTEKDSTRTGMSSYRERAGQFAGTYRYSNADMTTFGKSMLFFSQLVEISVSKEGFLLIETASLIGGEKSSVMGGFEGASQWVEVEPLYFERVDGAGQIAFGLDNNGDVAYLYSGQGYHSTFNKLPWYESQSFHIILIELVALLLVSIVIYTFLIWPLSALIRKLRNQAAERPASRIAVVARLWAGVVGGMLALFVLRAIGVLYAIDTIGGMPNFVWGVSQEMIGALDSIYLPVMLAFALPVFSVLAWVKGWWKITTRMHYTLVTLAVFAGIWWVNYWNILGFRM